MIARHAGLLALLLPCLAAPALAQSTSTHVHSLVKIADVAVDGWYQGQPYSLEIIGEIDDHMATLGPANVSLSAMVLAAILNRGDSSTLDGTIGVVIEGAKVAPSVASDFIAQVESSSGVDLDLASTGALDLDVSLCVGDKGMADGVQRFRRGGTTQTLSGGQDCHNDPGTPTNDPSATPATSFEQCLGERLPVAVTGVTSGRLTARVDLIDLASCGGVDTLEIDVQLTGTGTSVEGVPEDLSIHLAGRALATKIDGIKEIAHLEEDQGMSFSTTEHVSQATVSGTIKLNGVDLLASGPSVSAALIDKRSVQNAVQH